MIKLLFVITTNVNVGDLSFGIEWVNELGRKNYSHAFLLDKSIRRFVHDDDRIFLFDPERPVKETILEAVHAFSADVIIFASNSYWNIQGQAGAERGKWDDEILDLNIPVLSFDPLEGLTEMYVKLWDVHIAFPPVPEKVLALRDSPNIPSAPNIRHFRILNRFEPLARSRKHEILRSAGISNNKKTVFFPIASNCYHDCRKTFYDYYEHVAHIIQECRELTVQFLVVAPEIIPEFAKCDNVIQLAHQPYETFLEILKSSDLYLTDCGVASSFLHAMSSSLPSVVLCNSYDTLDSVPGYDNTRTAPRKGGPSGKASFMYDNLYPYRVFPYGMVELFEHIEKVYKFNECYRKAELLETHNLAKTIEKLLFDEDTRQSVMGKCAEMKSLCMKLQSPSLIIEEALS